MSEPNVKDSAKPSGPVSISKGKIHIDRDICIGAATCVAIAPKAFMLDSDAKAVILNSIDEEDSSILLDAARGCPTSAITLEDETGQKLFPK